MTKQPEWKYIKNLGDASPVEYGGYFIFEDQTNVYSPEAEKWEAETHQVYRIILDLMFLLDGHLIPLSIHQASLTHSLPHPIKDYIEWFDKDIKSIESCMGMKTGEYIKMFCSNDPLELARAYEALYDYCGWENGDSYPLTLTEEEAEKRYQNYK